MIAQTSFVRNKCLRRLFVHDFNVTVAEYSIKEDKTNEQQTLVPVKT